MKRSKKQAKRGVGVILCNCAGTLAKRLDFGAIAKACSAREGIGSVHVTTRLCDAKTCLKAVTAVAKGSDRLVLAACEREIFAEALNQGLKRARIPDGLTTAINIREQCAWVHSDRAAAGRKAQAAIDAAISRAVCQHPIASKQEPVNRDVLILGGGMAAMQAALHLARLGHKVTLAGREPELGGNAARLSEFFGYVADPDTEGGRKSEAEQIFQRALTSLIENVRKDASITFIGKAALRSFNGEVGRFDAVIADGDKALDVAVGAVVLACGEFQSFPFPAGLAKPGNDAVMDLPGLAQRLRADRALPESVAIFLDLAEEQGRAINALALAAAERLARDRRRRVLLFARHIRVAALGLEALYRRAREAGVLIMRYRTKPKIDALDTGFQIEHQDIQTGATLTESVESVVMADARFVSAAGLQAAETLVRHGPGSAAQANNVWLTAALTSRPGIFTLGMARGNSECREALNDAGAVAAEIHALLGADSIKTPQDAAVVDTDRCVLCLTCRRTCPHGAISVDEPKKAAVISEKACRRCGLCATMCPALAIQLPRFTDDQILADIGNEPETTVFACENSAWPAAAQAGVNRAEYSSSIRLIRVPCIGKVDARQVLKALERGAQKVMLLGCHRENCRYLFGADHGAKRVARLREMLTKAGVDGARLKIGHLTEFESGRFLQFVKE